MGRHPRADLVAVARIALEARRQGVEWPVLAGLKHAKHRGCLGVASSGCSLQGFEVLGVGHGAVRSRRADRICSVGDRLYRLKARFQLGNFLSDARSAPSTTRDTLEWTLASASEHARP